MINLANHLVPRNLSILSPLTFHYHFFGVVMSKSGVTGETVWVKGVERALGDLDDLEIRVEDTLTRDTMDRIRNDLIKDMMAKKMYCIVGMVYGYGAIVSR